MIKAVIVDAGGVLYDWKSAYCQALTEIGVDFDVFLPELMRRVKPAELGEISLSDLFKQTLKVFDKQGKWKSLRKKIPSTFKPIMPTFSLLKQLRKEGYKLAVLTNNPRGVMDEWEKVFPYKHLFDLIIDSSVIRLRKPNPEIFLLACRKLNIKLEECLFVDDSQEPVNAAKRLGFNTFLFAGDPVNCVNRIKHNLKRLNDSNHLT